MKLRSWTTLTRALQLTHQDLRPFFMQNWGLILGTFVGCELVDSYFVMVSQMLGSNPQASQMSIVIAATRLCLALMELTLLTILVPMRLKEREQGLPAHSFWNYASHYAVPLTLENLKALGLTLIWSLAFVIPGIIKYLQYQFVSFVVLVDPDYEDGKVDALQRSKELTKGILLLLLGILWVGAILSWGLGYVEEAHPLHRSPLIWSLTFVGTLAFNLYLSVLLYEIYRVRMDGLPDLSADQKEIE
jgi:hypothetical protein